MVLIGDCIACQHGHHGGHIAVPGPVPEGVIGGCRCDCTGDCAERNAERIRRERESIVDTTDYSSVNEVMEFFRQMKESQDAR